MSYKYESYNEENWVKLPNVLQEKLDAQCKDQLCRYSIYSGQLIDELIFIFELIEGKELTEKKMKMVQSIVWTNIISSTF